MSESIITRKGQITIPKEIRDQLNAKEGQKVAFFVRGEEVVLKVVKGSILDLKGSVKPRSRPEDFDGIRRSVRKAVSRKIARNE
jgi:AbrB family looped-hinge helix DNA binding protein